MTMYGSQKVKAYCCECEKVTLHKYEFFGRKNASISQENSHISQEKASSKGLIFKMVSVFLSTIFVDAPNGDYKCSVCGTNLSTPDNLD